MSCVVCDTNAAEVDEFVEQWRHSGVTQIWLHPLNNRAGLLAEDVRPVDLTPWAERFAFDPLVLVDLFKNSPQGEGLCKIARSMIFISADGEMRLCALDYKRENAYGNLKTAQLEEMHSDKRSGVSERRDSRGVSILRLLSSRRAGRKTNHSGR